MIPRLITSLQHPLVKKWVKLREDRRFRQEERAALIVGETVVREIAKLCKIKKLISSSPLNIAAEHTALVSPAVMQKIIGHPTDDLVAAEIYLPPPASLEGAKMIVVLDRLGDPGNVGTIFRTALALGWDGLFILHGTADPYNDKALRSSRGAPLLMPWKEGSWDEVRALLQSAPRQVVIADTQGISLSQMQFSSPLLLILGHETKGPSKEARALGLPVTIPLKETVESLNVAAAGAILLYHIHKELS